MKVLTKNHQRAKNHPEGLDAFPLKYEVLLNELERASSEGSAWSRAQERNWAGSRVSVLEPYE